MSLHLYWNVASQPARAVKCLLNMGRIVHQETVVDMVNNQTRTKEYLQMNPLGQIPFIIDGRFKLGESNAILVYLCEKYPDALGKYYGNTLQKRGLVNQHLSWYQNSFRPALFKIIFLKNYEGIKKQKPVYRTHLESAEKEMFNAMGELQRLFQLSKSSFITGEELTIADLQYFFEITNLIVYERPFTQFKLISGWFGKMLQIEEVKAIHEEWNKVAPLVTKTLNSVPIIESSKL